jgi:hypothetical protein
MVDMALFMYKRLRLPKSQTSDHRAIMDSIPLMNLPVRMPCLYRGYCGHGQNQYT